MNLLRGSTRQTQRLRSNPQSIVQVQPLSHWAAHVSSIIVALNTGKRSPNGFTDATSSAVLPASITSSPIYVIHSSLINLEMLKYFNISKLKLLNFQTPFSSTASDRLRMDSSTVGIIFNYFNTVVVYVSTVFNSWFSSLYVYFNCNNPAFSCNIQ